MAAWRRSTPMVDETQVGEVPEPSESRYWCISIFNRPIKGRFRAEIMALLTNGNVVARVREANECRSISGILTGC